jgi:hypothetical protein
MGAAMTINQAIRILNDHGHAAWLDVTASGSSVIRAEYELFRAGRWQSAIHTFRLNCHGGVNKRAVALWLGY